MRKLAAYAPFLLVFLAFAVPHLAFAANTTFFGPIVPAACNCANGAGWGCVLLVIGNLLNFMISIGVLACVAALAYAGFLWIANPLNAEYRSQGRGLLLNAVVGLVIALGAWLIVNTLLTTLTGSGVTERTAALGIGSNCLPTATDVTGGAGGTTGYTGTTTTPTGTGNNGFTYQSGIQAQVGDESAALSGILSCMSAKLPKGVGQISSISDSKITSGQATFASCAANGCAHAANSCHYGGSSCIGKSYAVDFGDEQNNSALTAAAQACGAKTLFEGNHLHVSIGAASGCGCNL